jgi:trans-aconitate methyltransferase
MDIKELSQLSGPPEAHWYYAAKFELLAATIRAFGARRIVDVGAGSGVFSGLLLERTDCEEATCVDPAYEQDHDEVINGKVLRFRRGYDGRDFDLILLMDVLEHVDDDVGLLRHVVASVSPGTPVFITVPAFRFLWSAHDVFLEHRRRYSAAMLDRTMTNASVKVDRIRYFYLTIFPIALLVRLLTRKRDPDMGSDLRPAPAAVGWLLKTVLKAERQLVFPVNRLAGLSVVGLGRTSSKVLGGAADLTSTRCDPQHQPDREPKAEQIKRSAAAALFLSNSCHGPNLDLGRKI